MDEVELLRRFCTNDPDLGEAAGALWSSTLDGRTAALVRIGALVAVAAPEPSLRQAVDDAITAGASSAQIIAVLDGMVDVVGLPRAVAAAPRIAGALGHGDDLVPDERTG